MVGYLLSPSDKDVYYGQGRTTTTFFSQIDVVLKPEAQLYAAYYLHLGDVPTGCSSLTIVTLSRKHHTHLIASIIDARHPS